MEQAIKYVKHSEIDTGKWNRCMDKAPNGLIYGYTFYLDHFAKHWDALILGDYEVLMALPWNRKYGIQYLYQPPFTPLCGLYGKSVDTALYGEFIRAIPSKFKLAEINLNGQPQPGNEPRKNLVLPLNAPYQTIYDNYNQNIKRNIKKAIELGCTVQKNIPVKNVLGIAMQQLDGVVKIDERTQQEFIKLYDFLHIQQNAITYGIFSKSNELLASCVFFYSHYRAYYILVGNTPNGKTLGASHYLIDRFIADHAGSNFTLDFEGSDIPSLAFFYSSFGAKEELYQAVRIDRLPWYVRMMRR